MLQAAIPRTSYNEILSRMFGAQSSRARKKLLLSYSEPRFQSFLFSNLFLNAPTYVVGLCHNYLPESFGIVRLDGVHVNRKSTVTPCRTV